MSVVSAATREACASLSTHLKATYRRDFVIGVGSEAENDGHDLVHHDTLVVYYYREPAPEVGPEWMGIPVILRPDGRPTPS